MEKAQKLSKKCNELVPDQPIYQDTYGWILYKLGRFVEAEVWLQKAVLVEAGSADILEHYGDVLYQVNRTQEALEYWKQSTGCWRQLRNIKPKNSRGNPS